MGTAQVAFAVEQCGGATGSDVTGSDLSHVTEMSMSGSMFCACAIGSCAISALVGTCDWKCP